MANSIRPIIILILGTLFVGLGSAASISTFDSGSPSGYVREWGIRTGSGDGEDYEGSGSYSADDDDVDHGINFYTTSTTTTTKKVPLTTRRKIITKSFPPPTTKYSIIEIEEGIVPDVGEYDLSTGIESVDSYSEETDLGEGVGPVEDDGHLTPKEEERITKLKSWINELSGHFESFKSKVSEVAKDLQSSLTKALEAKGISIKGIGYIPYSSFGDHISRTFNKVANLVPNLWQDLKHTVQELGQSVQDGAQYFIKRIGLVFNNLKGRNIVHNLKEKLNQGNEAASELFQRIGEKLKLWTIARRAHDHKVDGGLESSGNTENNNDDQTHWKNSHYTDPHTPNLLQSADVIRPLQTLFSQNVFNLNEIKHILEDVNKKK